MSTAYVEIDPDGDTLIVLPTLESTSARMLYEGSLQERLKSFATAMAAEREPVAEEVEVGHTPESEAQTHFRVSMKHLVLASPRAKRMFQGNYTEARPDADGLHRWTFEPLFDPAAFEIVMNAIHGYSHKMPRNVSLENMAKIAAIVDDLDCPQALWFFAKTWINWLKPNRKLDRFHLGHWILISFVFEEPVIFKEATEQAIRQTCGSFSSCMLPIRPKILGMIPAWVLILSCLTL
ncbi:hypothetical protein N0V84_004868 [Fusarium piperis]|uniref:BTB domain-containing protein n=1 Tax=Fusarium piperis TaxID=1435070 RepID=A0A9W8WEV5_9HYPO|nr:hypothetical protein N0V84_004868 [Fusarium piperis]